jgi:hypothetical protein
LRQTPCRCDYTAHGTDDPNEQRLIVDVTTPRMAPMIRTSSVCVFSRSRIQLYSSLRFVRL